MGAVRTLASVAGPTQVHAVPGGDTQRVLASFNSVMGNAQAPLVALLTHTLMALPLPPDQYLEVLDMVLVTLSSLTQVRA